MSSCLRLSAVYIWNTNWGLYAEKYVRDVKLIVPIERIDIGITTVLGRKEVE